MPNEIKNEVKANDLVLYPLYYAYYTRRSPFDLSDLEKFIFDYFKKKYPNVYLPPFDSGPFEKAALREYEETALREFVSYGSANTSEIKEKLTSTALYLTSLKKAMDPNVDFSSLSLDHFSTIPSNKELLQPLPPELKKTQHQDLLLWILYYTQINPASYSISPLEKRIREACNNYILRFYGEPYDAANFIIDDVYHDSLSMDYLQVRFPNVQLESDPFFD